MRRATTIALCLAVTLSPAAAYEDDVHYGLTRWLARNAGFSVDEAELIAQANVGYDHSGLSAITLVKHSACFPLRNDKQVAEEVQRIHFPGEGEVPSPPDKRVVTPGSTAALRELEAVILIPTDTAKHRLLQFGKSLHPLQDSWSHQGEPSSPLAPLCNPQYSWGHPNKRGGWDSHEADLSHRDLPTAIAMARATHASLCRYRIEVQKADKCATTFEELIGEVTALLEKRNKVAKAAWFKAHEFDDVRFLNATNVDDGGHSLGRHEPPTYSGEALAAARNSKRGSLPATQDAVFMRDFFEAWMTRKDLDAVVKEWIAVDMYRPLMGRGDARPIDVIAAEAQLKFWRVRDHGSLEGPMEGHNLIMRRLQSVPDLLQKGDQRYESLDQALLPFDETGIPILSWVLPNPGGSPNLVGVARIRHAPNELVIVVAGMVAGRYKVVSINSVVTK